MVHKLDVFLQMLLSKALKAQMLSNGEEPAKRMGTVNYRDSFAL